MFFNNITETKYFSIPKEDQFQIQLFILPQMKTI